MMVYIALCDARWNIRKVIRSIPACLAREGQDAREIFADQDCLDRLMEKSAGGSVTQRLKLRGADGRMAFATVKAVKEQVLLLVYEMEDKSQLPQMTEAQLCALDELPGMNTGPYGNEFYEIQKMNNRLVDSKRSLAKANMQLKETLEQIRKAENIIEILERDPITNLLTEKAFYEKADKILKENPDQDFDIIAVDIERFKIVNDAFGTAAGNQLLCDLSACLLDVGGGELSLSARIRADLFAVLAPHQEARYKSLEDNLGKFADSYSLPARIEVKAGIYRIEERDISTARMCDRAFIAVESIKGIFSKRLAYYDDSMRRKMLMEQKILDTMVESLLREDFLVYLQPKVQLGTGKMIGAEALVRWRHPELGMISPAEFIPVFEKNGFIYSLDMYVCRKACEILERWKATGMHGIPIAVNVSRMDIYHGDLPEQFGKLIETYGLKPQDLHLEITESAYISDSQQLLAVVERLRDSGFVVEMDDFGSGYSSLNTLSELPIDVLKLDLKFLREETETKRRHATMQAVINLALELGLQVIAEGVETKQQAQRLALMGCQYAQGYYYGHPMPQEEFEEHFMDCCI